MINKWNYSRIDTLNYCLRRFYLRYKLHEPSLRLSAYVKGSLLHTAIEKFWDYYGTEEEVEKDKNDKKKKAKDKKHFFDRETFADYWVGQWKSIIMADLRMIKKVSEFEKSVKGFRDEQKLKRLNGEVIAWRNEGEKYMIQAIIPSICKPLFDKVIEEGKPLYSELKFDFLLNKRRFDGRIDEVRIRQENGERKIVIRDFKSGSPWLGEMKLHYDPQLTFYNMGLCSLCIKDEEFAKKLGLGGERDRLRQRLENENILIYEDFMEEFFMIEALQKIEEAKQESLKPSPRKQDFANEEDYIRAKKRRDWVSNNVPEVILKTKRNDVHFFELIDMINSGEKRIQKGEIPIAESGRKCDICDMKYVCSKKILERKVLDETGEIKDRYGQEFFSFTDPDSIELAEKKRYTPLYKQKKIIFRKRKQ